MRKAQFGHSLLAGVVIVVLAVLLDRVTAAYAPRQLPTASHIGLPWRSFALTLAGSFAFALFAAQLLPALEMWPTSLTYSPAQAINAATNRFVLVHGDLMSALKSGMQFFVLLPVKLGFERAIAPFT